MSEAALASRMDEMLVCEEDPFSQELTSQFTPLESAEAPASGGGAPQPAFLRPASFRSTPPISASAPARPAVPAYLERQGAGGPGRSSAGTPLFLRSPAPSAPANGPTPVAPAPAVAAKSAPKLEKPAPVDLTATPTTKDDAAARAAKGAKVDKRNGAETAPGVDETGPEGTDNAAEAAAKDEEKKDAATGEGEAAGQDGEGKGDKAGARDKGRTGSATKVRKRSKAGADEEAEEAHTVPAIDTASPAISRAPVVQELRGESFRPAEPPAFKVQPKPGGKAEPPNPERAKAVAQFREAIALAARLHAGFLAAAEQAAASVRSTEATLASRGQGDLASGLATLRAGLDQARLELDIAADAADAYIEMRRRQTSGAINALAKSAAGTLGKLKKDEDDKFKAHDGERAKKGEVAQGELDTVTRAGSNAAGAVANLEHTTGKHFPINVEAMDAAINEAVGLRIPKRSKERAKTYEEERDAQSTHLSGVFKQMNDALATQFPLIKKGIDDTAKSAEDSIGKSRDAARKQLAKGAREMRRAVAQARAGGHEALIEQHNTLRRQMIAAHRDRATRENAQAQQRAARGVAGALNAAKAQQTGADAMRDALAREAVRPPDDFARVMAASASGLLRQLGKTGPEQRDRVERSVRTGEDDARAQSLAMGIRLAVSAVDSAAQLGVSSRSAGKSIDKQARTGVKPFDKIPGQIPEALKSAMTSATEHYLALNQGSDEKPGAGQMIISAQATIDNAIAGKDGGGGSTPAPTPAPAPAPAGGAKGPKEKPAEFRKRAEAIANKPLEEEGIVALVSTAHADIPARIDGKAGRLYDALSATSTNVESVMVELRGLTEQQGRALSAVYEAEKGGRELAEALRTELNKFFSSDYTNKENIAAALAYLAGDTVKAAKHELNAAVYLWNDTGRSEKVLRALTPEALDKLNQAHPDVMTDVSDDLDGSEKQIFDNLRQIKPTGHLEGDALKQQLEENYRLLGAANAHALKRDIDQGLQTKGEEGGDKVTDTVSTAYTMAGADAIAGGDGAYEDPKEAEARRQAVWKETNTRFADVAKTLPDGSPNVEAEGEGHKLGAIARYAAAARPQTEFVPDDGPHGGHYRTVMKGLDPRQARLIDDIARTGPNSEDTAASTIEFETNRKEGKPREDRLRKALLGEDLMAAREGESDKERAERLADKTNDEGEVIAKGDLQKTKDRKAAVLQKVAERRAEGQRTADGQPVAPMKPDEVQKQITDQLDARFAGDKTGAEYTKSMIESETFEPDPQKAFDFALAHDERNKETLKATTERMNRDQIKDAVKKWDDAHPEESLYSRLGLYKKGGGKLEGDAKNEVEIAFRGKPRNDKEKALIAVMMVEQQRRDGTAAGRTLAGSDYDRMIAKQEKVLEYMGIRRDQIDETGDIKAVGPDGKEFRGKFDENGKLVLDPGERREFESAMRFAHMNAESYKQAVDRISQGIVMALVVAAAVITTFVTFGGAAAIWGPILITAAAGFAGMAMTAAIRGDRYTSAEMQRDFVMTLVSAATAGLGAAAGAGAKGAGAMAKGAAAVEKGAQTAAKAAGAAKAVAAGQKLATGAAGAGAKQGLSFGAKALQFGKEVVVGGTTNSINSFAGAAMDPENRRQGKALSKGIDGGVKGFLGGALGAAVTKPASALGRPMGKGAERMAGNVGSGFTQRVAESRVGQAMGDPHQSWAESIESAKEGIAQDAIQSFGEHHAEGAAERRAARKAQAAARAETPGAPPARAAGEGPHPEAPRLDAPQPGALHPDTPHPEAQARRAPDDDGVARAQAVKDAIPPEVRPVAAEAAAADPPAAGDPALRQRPITVEPADPAVLPPRPAASEAEPQVRPAAAGKDDAPGVKAVRGPEPSEPRRPVPEGPQPEASGKAAKPGSAGEKDPKASPKRKKPPPLPEKAGGPRWADDDFLEGAVMMDADSTNRTEIDKSYRNAVREDPSREVAIYRNPVTGEHIMVFGNETEVFIGANKHVGEGPAAAEPFGLGQDWKEILPSDRGRWVLEAHYHPGFNGQHDVAPLARRLPSTGEGGIGDFGVLRQESKQGGGTARESVIHYTHNGREHTTVFGYNPKSREARYWITIDNPHTGQRETHSFAKVSDYEAWAHGQGVHTNRDDPAPARPDPSRPGSGAPDETLTLKHGTTKEDAQALREQGIDPHRKTGEEDDFGRGFYMTFDEANAQAYADHRSKGKGGEVLGTTIKLSELGVVVDVRENGAHRAAWDAFLDRSPPAYPPWGGPFFRNAREFLEGTGKLRMNEIQRGAVFEAFLTEAKLGHADAVRGDLGKGLTAGISAPGGGEQIAIRSKALADKLNRLMGFGADPADARPVKPGAAKTPQPPPPTVKVEGDDAPTGAAKPALEDLAPAPAAKKAADSEPPVPPIPRPGEPEASKAIVLAPIENLDPHQLSNRVDNALDVMAPGPTPRVKGPGTEGRARGFTTDEIVADFASRRPQDVPRLTELMLLGGETMARAMRAETEVGMSAALGKLVESLAQPIVLTPKQRAELVDLMVARAARESPNEPPALREGRIRATVARWEKQGMSPRAIRKFTADALDMRGVDRVGFATPARRARDLGDLALKPKVDAAVAAAAGTITNAAVLQGFLAATRQPWLVRFAHEGMIPHGAGEPPLVERWHAYLAGLKPPATPSLAHFEGYMRGHMKRFHRPAMSELEAAFSLGGRKPEHAFSNLPIFNERLEILKSAIDPDTGQNQPNIGGTDLIGYRRADDKIVISDDKALTAGVDNKGEVSKVGAFFPTAEQAKANKQAGLIQNLADDARTMARLLNDQVARGYPVDSRHLLIPGRLAAASADLEAAFPNGMVLDDTSAPVINAILRKHGIELVVTSMAGTMTGVSDKLRKAGVGFRPRPNYPEPPAEDDEQP